MKLQFNQSMYDPNTRTVSIRITAADIMPNEAHRIRGSDYPDYVHLISTHTGDTRTFHYKRSACNVAYTYMYYYNADMDVQLKVIFVNCQYPRK